MPERPDRRSQPCILRIPSNSTSRTSSSARGPVESTIQDILGGVRSACTYVGARRLKELTMRTTFVRVSMQLNEVFGKAP